MFNWFKKDKVVPEPYIMFDMDKITEMDSLTPLQIIDLVSMVVGVKPSEAILPRGCREDYPHLSSILKAHIP